MAWIESRAQRWGAEGNAETERPGLSARPWRSAGCEAPELCGRNRDADRAAHARAAEPAIAHRVLGEVLLVVVLGEVEGGRVENLGGNRSETPRRERLGIRRLAGFRRRALR